MSNAATPTDTPPAKATAPAAEPEAPKAAAPKPAAPKAPAPKPAAPKAAAPKKSDAKPGAGKSDTAKQSGGKSGGVKDAAPEVRSAAQIQADIDAAQARLASRVDELSDRINPQNLAEDAMGGVKRVFVNEDGTPKPKPIAIVVGSLTALLVLRKIFHR